MQRINITPAIYVLVDDIGCDARPHIERARATVGRLMDTAAGRHVAILHREDGAPYPEGLDLHISVSHSQHRAALAVSTGPEVGVDIEEPREAQLQRIAPRVFTPADMDIIATLPGGLLQAWTIKEAAYKAAGMADIADLREIRLTATGPVARGLGLKLVYSAGMASGGWMSVVVK